MSSFQDLESQMSSLSTAKLAANDQKNAYSEKFNTLNPIYYRIKYFSPAWFSASMGVGISAAIFYSFPFAHPALRKTGICIWVLNMVLFTLFSIMLILRTVMFPKQIKKMLHHIGQFTFVGCIPMALCTIINMMYLVCTDSTSVSKDIWKGYWALWWLSVVMSVFSCWGGFYVMVCHQTRESLEAVNATILLPIVSMVVSSSTGGLIAEGLPSTGLKGTTLVVSFIMWANGEFLALAFMVIYIYRLLLKKVQPKAIVLSTLLPVGPMGQGAFGVLLLGELYRQVFRTFSRGNGTGETAATNAQLYTGLVDISKPSVDSISFVTMAIALFMLSIGLFWICLTLLFLTRERPPCFNMSWWATTFPLGTMAMGWYRLNTEFNNEGLKYIGAIFGAVVVVNVVICFIASIRYAIFDDLLFKQAENETQ